MQNQKDRVIIDTNLWISYLLTKELTRLDLIIASYELTLVFSQELIDEIIEVTQRKKFRRYFSLKDVESMLLKIRSRSEFVKVTSSINDCKDPKDNFLLSLAVDGEATHLITGDKDLLILGKYNETVILTITQYFTQL